MKHTADEIDPNANLATARGGGFRARGAGVCLTLARAFRRHARRRGHAPRGCADVASSSRAGRRGSLPRRRRTRRRSRRRDGATPGTRPRLARAAPANAMTNATFHPPPSISTCRPSSEELARRDDRGHVAARRYRAAPIRRRCFAPPWTHSARSRTRHRSGTRVGWSGRPGRGREGPLGRGRGRVGRRRRCLRFGTPSGTPRSRFSGGSSRDGSSEETTEGRREARANARLEVL